MEENIRIFLPIDHSLLKKIEADITGKDTNAKILKCVEFGYRALTPSKRKGEDTPPSLIPTSER